MKLCKTKNKKIKIKLILLFLYLIILYLFNEIHKKRKKILLYPYLIIDDFKNYFDLINNHHTLDLFITRKKIENIFILITIFPFIQKEILITKKHYNNKDTFSYELIIDLISNK